MSRPVSQAELLEAHVLRAKAALEDGGLVRDVLTGLWKAAFAAGVTAGRTGPSAGASSRNPGAARHPASAWPASVRAMAEGWRWGSAALHEVTTAGTRFTYGGCDPARPTCERPASSAGMRSHRQYMRLEDTGEEVPFTVMFWCRKAEGEASDA